MPSLQIKAILELIRDYHHQLADQLESLAGHESDQRIRLLLDYMARHEINFEKTLAGYENDTAKSILQTWIKYVPDDAVTKATEQLNFHDEMPADEILAAVITFDRALTDMYRELAEETSVPRIHELFTKLIDLEDRKDRQFSISILEMADQ
ncbi:hypothetical protein [Planctomycetes bacterium TBK1r]|uniref:DUF2383 domain-containing protein n=1 Tax=Stieleria magnilauensis TaxID=2527963 RepID=A0ABX5XVM3_9BACT|nr:hypothetical protein TBK1r_48420 [Planctomycetes bacterium TBK1r]